MSKTYNIEDRRNVSASHRKVEFVSRYHVPNKNKYPEAYAHHLLFMFYPFRGEEQLKAGELLLYSAKLLEVG